MGNYRIVNINSIHYCISCTDNKNSKIVKIKMYKK